MENDDTQTISFIEDNKMYSVIDLPMLSVDYDFQKMRRLFYDLASRFTWDICWYWPDSDSTDQIRISYGVDEQPDMTQQNETDYSTYLSALAKCLGLDDSIGIIEQWVRDISGDNKMRFGTRDIGSIDKGYIVFFQPWV